MAFKFLGLFRIMFVWGILQIMLVVSSYQSIIKVFRIGDDLRLSCPSQVGSNKTWWFEGKSLDNNTIHTNETTILQISNVIEKNQGIYWCGSSWQQEMNVTVLVGDLPSPPRHLYTTSDEFNKILHWTSANSTGGLPTHYSVHRHLLCINKLSCSQLNTGVLKDSVVLPECDSIKHVDRKNYQCDLESSQVFSKYRATVYAVNPLGNSSASILFSRPNVFKPKTTPSPPLQLNATEVQPGKVRLTWKSQRIANSYSIITYYKVFYREGDSNNNKTWPTGIDTTVVIDNLRADTKYTFYVMKQFRASDIEYSPFSTPAIITLHTECAAPDQPPQDLRCSLMKDDSFNVSFVGVSWKPPSKKHFNGPLTVYEILHGTNNKTILSVNASQTNINLTFPKPHKLIQISSNVCNKCGCSGISNSCYVKVEPDSTMTKLSNPSKIVGIILGLLVSICAVIIVMVVVYCRFCRKKKTLKTANMLPDLEIYGIYDEPENNVDEVEYDKPLI